MYQKQVDKNLQIYNPFKKAGQLRKILFRSAYLVLHQQTSCSKINLQCLKKGIFKLALEIFVIFKPVGQRFYRLKLSYTNELSEYCEKKNMFSEIFLS